MASHAAQVEKKGQHEYHVTTVRTEVLDRTGLTMRRRQVQAELEATEQELQRLQENAAALRDQLSQIDAALKD